VPDDIIQKHKSLLTEKDEQLFVKYLRGFIGDAPRKSLSGHFIYLKIVHSFFDKVRYLRDILFPSKAFMVQTYKIKKPSLVLFYYPYRYWIGVKGVVNYLKNKKNP